MKQVTVLAVWVLLVFIASHQPLSAEVRVMVDAAGAQDTATNFFSAQRAIAIEGEITAGDFERFVWLVREGQGTIGRVYLFSPGGDFREAMKIGRAIRALELSSSAPMRDSKGNPFCDSIGDFVLQSPDNCVCASACFFVHVGAVRRNGNYLAVHRPYFATREFGKLSQSDAMKAFDALQNSAREYMQEMGVPRHLQEDVLVRRPTDC